MKAAVVIPPVEDFYFTQRRFASLGAQKGVEILTGSGINTVLYDFTKGHREQIKLPRSVQHLKQYILENESGPCSFFTSYRHYGPAIAKCASIMAERGYDIVFVSLFAYCYADSAADFASALRKLDPAIKIAASGAGVSVFPEYFRECFDYIIPGEAEIFAKELQSSLLHGSPVSSFKINFFEQLEERFGANSRKDFSADCPHTEEGEFLPSVSLPFSGRKSVFISVMLSRGCFNKCRFCSNFITHGRSFRKADTESLAGVLSGIGRQIMQHAGKKIFVNIEDDNLLYDRNYFLRSLRIIKNFFLQYASDEHIFFSAENGLDYSLLDKDMCQKLISDYNFRQFNFTLASADNGLSLSQSRDSDTAKLEKLLQYLNEKKIPAVTYFIAGLAGDTPEKTVESLLFLDRHPGLSGISMFYAVPGLPDFSDKSVFKETSPALCRGTSAWPWNRSLTTGELITAFRLSRTINFLKKEGNLTETESALKTRILSDKKIYTIAERDIITEPPGLAEDMAELFFNKR